MKINFKASVLLGIILFCQSNFDSTYASTIVNDVDKYIRESSFYDSVVDSSGKGEKGSLIFTGDTELSNQSIIQKEIIINEKASLRNVYISQLHTTAGIKNDGTLTISDGSSNDNNISGNGDLIISSSLDITNTGKIEQNTITNNVPSYRNFITDANNLKTQNGITNNGKITFTGGTNTNSIIGGTVFIGDGNNSATIYNDGNIESDTTINNNAVLYNLSENASLNKVTLNNGATLNTFANSSIKNYVNGSIMNSYSTSTTSIFANGSNENIIDFDISGSGTLNIIAPEIKIIGDRRNIKAKEIYILTDSNNTPSKVIFDSIGGNISFASTDGKLFIAENNELSVLNGYINPTASGYTYPTVNVVNDGTLKFADKNYDPKTIDSSGKGEKGSLIFTGDTALSGQSIIQKEIIINEKASLGKVWIDQLHTTAGIKNDGTLTIYAGSSNDNNISGNGDLIINSSSTITNTGKIEQNTITNNTSSGRNFITDANNLKTQNGITNNGKITFTGGTNTNRIKDSDPRTANASSLEIWGDVINKAPIETSKITVTGGNKFTTDVSNLKLQDGINLNNDSVLNLYGDGTLDYGKRIGGNNNTVIFGNTDKLSNIILDNGSTYVKNYILENSVIKEGNSTLKTNSDTTLTIKNNSVLDLQDNKSNCNSYTVQNLIIDSSATKNSGIKIDVDLSQRSYISDQINVAGIASGNLNVLGINITKNLDGAIGSTKEFQLVKGSGDLSGLTITSSVKSACDNFVYSFEVNEFGNLVATKQEGYSIQDILNNSNSDSGKVSSYTMGSDISRVDSLGTLTRTNPNEAREFTMNGNSNNITGTGTSQGYTINSGDTLNLTDIKSFSNFDSAVNNNGTIVVDGVNFNGNSTDINNNGSLIFKGNKSSLGAGITGNGTTSIQIDMDLNDSKITQDAINILAGNTVNVNDAENIQTTTGLVNNGTLNFNNGGTNTNVISGTGKTNIFGNFVSENIIAQEINLNSSSSFTANADNIQGIIKSTTNSILNINGGTLNSNVDMSSGSVNIMQSMINNGSIVDDSLSVNAELTNNASITTNNLTLNDNISGTGSLSIKNNTNISSSDKNITQDTVTNLGSNTLTVRADQITTTNGIINDAGTLNFVGGRSEELTISSNVIGNGTTNISGKVNNTSVISQNQITNNGELTSSIDNLISTVLTNNGTLNITGGTLTNTINGSGDININNDMLVKTTNTGSVTGVINVNSGLLSLSDNVSNLFTGAAAINMADGTTLNLCNKTSSATTMDNLHLAAGDTMNLYIDWKDTFNGNRSNILGNVILQQIDLNRLSSNDSYKFTNLGDKISVSDNVKLITAPEQQAKNFVSYDSTSGNLSASFSNLADAIKNATNTSLYSMKYSESAEGTTLDGKLIVNGNGSAIKEKGIQIGKTRSNIDLVLIDTDIKNVKVTTDNSGAITVKGGNTLKYIAETKNTEMTGTITSGTATNANIIYLEKDTNGNAKAEIIANQGQKIVINDDIRSNDKNNLVVFTGDRIEFNGVFDPATASMSASKLIRSGYDEAITWDLNGGVLRYTNDNYLYDPTHHNTPALLNTMNFNGGALDLRNSMASNILLSAITLNANSSIYVDADLAAGRMDNFGSTPSTGSAMLHVADINLISDAATATTTINFTSDPNLISHVDYTGGQNISYSPIYKYLVNYDNTNGNFVFTRLANGSEGFGAIGTNSSYLYNPAILASSVAAQLGGYSTILDNFNQGFNNIDNIMSMPKATRLAIRDRNKYAINEGTPIYIDSISKAVYFEPSVSFERVNLSNGPQVDNISYNTYVGGTSELMELSRGWMAQYGAFIGYNGSTQNYETVGMNQSGGSFGLNSLFIKDNYFVDLTANVGASVVNANTKYGNEFLSMLRSGVALKTGYNFEFKNGKYILQPSAMIGYSFANTFSYRNAAGVNISSNPLHAITIQPGLKFIANLKNNWQPYASVSMVWNIMDKTKFYANNVSLPDMSIAPYIQYGLGCQKKVNDKFSGYGQVMLRNGGRNSVSLSFGLKWQLGKNQKNKQQL